MKVPETIAKHKRKLKAAYSSARQDMKKLHDLAGKNVLPAHLQKAGKELKVLRKKTFIFEAESELSILMDYCLYNYPTKAKSYIVRCSETYSERGCEYLLPSIQNNRYSIFKVEGLEKGLGILAEDILFGQNLFVLEKALSSTGWKNLIIAGRFLPLMGEDTEKYALGIFAGAMIPLQSAELIERLFKSMDTFFRKHKINDSLELSHTMKKQLEMRIISTCLKHGASEYVRYQ